MKPETIFKEYCVENGMRFTRERHMIIEEIYRQHGHFDIDNLFLRIRNRNPRIKLAKGSIYRTLPHLVQAGLIRASLTEEGHVCYEHTLGHPHHDHMKCLKCGRVFEFYDSRIDRIQQEICKKHNFEMRRHMHVIGGYCSKCQKEKTGLGR